MGREGEGDFASGLGIDHLRALQGSDQALYLYQVFERTL